MEREWLNETAKQLEYNRKIMTKKDREIKALKALNKELRHSLLELFHELSSMRSSAAEIIHDSSDFQKCGQLLRCFGTETLPSTCSSPQSVRSNSFLVTTKKEAEMTGTSDEGFGDTSTPRCSSNIRSKLPPYMPSPRRLKLMQEYTASPPLPRASTMSISESGTPSITSEMTMSEYPDMQDKLSSSLFSVTTNSTFTVDSRKKANSPTPSCTVLETNLDNLDLKISRLQRDLQSIINRLAVVC